MSNIGQDIDARLEDAELEATWLRAVVAELAAGQPSDEDAEWWAAQNGEQN